MKLSSFPTAFSVFLGASTMLSGPNTLVMGIQEPVQDQATASLSTNVVWKTQDAGLLVDFHSESDAPAVSYESSTCNVSEKDLGYVTVDLGFSQLIDGVDVTLKGNKYCNLFVNVWNEGEEEPLAPLDEPITALPTQAPTKKATPAPTMTPTQALKATSKAPTPSPTAYERRKGDLRCYTCVGPPLFCEQLYAGTICKEPNNYCINEITNHSDGTRKVNRKCGNFDQDCFNDWYSGTSDNDRCQQFDGQIMSIAFECTFCCVVDNCNIDLKPKKETLYNPTNRRTKEVSNSNVYSSGTDHEYTTEIQGNTLAVSFSDRDVRYIRVWVGKQFDSSTTGIVEIRAIPATIEGVGEALEAQYEVEDEGVGEALDFFYSVDDLSPAPPAPQVNGKSSGDPHFKTFAGHKFDFHGGCDLVLLDSPNFTNGHGLSVHIRTKINTWWSYIETAVVQIGRDTLELMGGKSGDQYWINGKPGNGLNDGDTFELSGFEVVYRKVSKIHLRFRVDLGNGDAMSLESFKDFVAVNVNLKANTKNNFKGSVGLLGSYPHGAMLARDGTTILEDPDSFGKAWQVLASEPMLFHQAPEVPHPMECAMPDSTSKAKARRRLGETLITEEEAAIACEHADEDDHNACVFDVLATNDKEMAGAY